MFPPMRRRDGRNGGGRRKKSTPKPRPLPPCSFVDSGSSDYRGVPICGWCDMPRDHRRHDLPPTPDEAAVIDRRRLGEGDQSRHAEEVTDEAA